MQQNIYHYDADKVMTSQILTMLFFDRFSEESKSWYITNIGTTFILERLRDRDTINAVISIWYSMNYLHRSDASKSSEIPVFHPFDLKFCPAFFALCLDRSLKLCGTVEELKEILMNHFYKEETKSEMGKWFNEHGIDDPYSHFGTVFIPEMDKDDRFELKKHFFFVPNKYSLIQKGKEKLHSYLSEKYKIIVNFECFCSKYDRLREVVEQHFGDYSWWDYVTEEYYKTKENGNGKD